MVNAQIYKHKHTSKNLITQLDSTSYVKNAKLLSITVEWGLKFYILLVNHIKCNLFDPLSNHVELREISLEVV